MGEADVLPELIRRLLCLGPSGRVALRSYHYLKKELGDRKKEFVDLVGSRSPQSLALRAAQAALNYRAEVAIERGQLFAGWMLLAQVRSLAPNDASTPRLLQRIEEERKKLATKAGWNSQRRQEALAIARQLREEERYAEAESCLTCALNFEWNHVDALNELAAIRLAQNDHGIARRLIEASLTIDPLNEIAQLNCDHLNELLEKAISVHPADGHFAGAGYWEWPGRTAQLDVKNCGRGQTLGFDIVCPDQAHRSISPRRVVVHVGHSGVRSYSFPTGPCTLPVSFEAVERDFGIKIEADVPSPSTSSDANARLRPPSLRIANLRVTGNDGSRVAIVETGRYDDDGISDSISKHRFQGDARDPRYVRVLDEFLLNPTVLLELNSRCNFHCHYCRSSTSTRQKSFMAPELFRQLLPQLRDITKQPLRLHIDGEPTLHPQFLELALEANRAGHRIALATNGSNLRREFLGIDMSIVLNISTSEEELRRRSSMRFNVYLTKIEQYVRDWLDVDNTQDLSLKVYTSTLDRWNMAAVKAKQQFVFDFIGRLGLTGKSCWQGKRNFERFEYRKADRRSFSLAFQPLTEGGLYPNISRLAALGARMREDRGFCDSIWKTLAVLSDGSVCFCCVDITGETSFTGPGVLLEKGLKEIWLGHPRVKRLRKDFLSGNVRLPICRKCLEPSPHREQYLFKEIFPFQTG